MTRRKFTIEEGSKALGQSCPGCQVRFVEGDQATFVPIGPGSDPDARVLAREGKPYNAVSIIAHWACVTGEGRSEG